jgi:hypothetical protein
MGSSFIPDGSIAERGRSTGGLFGFESESRLAPYEILGPRDSREKAKAIAPRDRYLTRRVFGNAIFCS